MREGEIRDWSVRALAIILLGAMASVSYWYSVLLRQGGDTPTAVPNTPDFVVETLSMTQFDAQGRARYRLFADELRHYANSEEIALTRPHLITLYPDSPQVRAQAEQGLVQGGGERVDMTGSVKVIREGDADNPALTLLTESLTAWPDEDRYASNAPAQIERGAGLSRTRAERIELDNARRDLQFKGNVRTQIAPRSATQTL